MLAGGGLVLGAVAALSLTRLMGEMLYKVSPRDPLIFGFATIVTLIASLASCWLPALRANASRSGKRIEMLLSRRSSSRTGRIARLMG